MSWVDKQPELRIKLGETGMVAEVWVGSTKVNFIRTIRAEVNVGEGTTRLEVEWVWNDLDPDLIVREDVLTAYQEAHRLLEPFLKPQPPGPRPVYPTVWEHLTKDDA